MYVHRTTHEQALIKALKGKQHIVIHGESGTGKSWLYKKVLADAGIRFETANLANASRLGSITAELSNVAQRDGHQRKVEVAERVDGGLDAVFANFTGSKETRYVIGSKEPLELCFAHLSTAASGQASFLVLDNLEMVFSNKAILKELADIIALCDDEKYAAYGVRLMIVGVPADLKRYYYNTPHSETVANRLIELPEVSRLTGAECDSLVKKGFERLGYSILQEHDFLAHVRYVTLRIPQMVHEYCLECANEGLSTKQIHPGIWSQADSIWAASKLVASYSAIESHMNERDTKAGRRNQVLYALSKCDDDEVRTATVEELVRREFPGSTSDVTLNVAQILGQLAKADADDSMPLLKKTAKEDGYTFVNPRVRMVMRAMLRKTADEKVERRALSASG